jgi:hypothetical protein
LLARNLLVSLEDLIFANDANDANDAIEDENASETSENQM